MSGPDNLRRATVDDAGSCARIVHDWVMSTDWMPKRFSVEELTDMIRAAIPEREVWVTGDPPDAYLSLNPAISQVVALYSSRPGAGLGRALMDHAKMARDYLQLWSHEPNTKAHRFYRREGFVEVERNPEGGDGLPELRMEWHR